MQLGEEVAADVFIYFYLEKLYQPTDPVGTVDD